MTAPEATDRIEPWVWRISAIVVLGSIMSILDTTIVNVALSTLGRELHSSIAQSNGSSPATCWPLAAVIPLAGWLARRFGAKRST